MCIVLSFRPDSFIHLLLICFIFGFCGPLFSASVAGGDPRSAASGSVGGSHDVILPECRLLTFPSGEVNGKEEEERGGERRREEERGGERRREG